MPKGKGNAPANGFKKGRKKTGGRAPGSCGRETKLLKEAIMIAMELEGSDSCGTGKLIGFMRKVAREELSAFCGMAARLIPMEINAEINASRDVRVEVTYRSVEEVRRELESRGIFIEYMLAPPSTTMIDAETIELDEVDDGAVSAAQD